MSDTDVEPQQYLTEAENQLKAVVTESLRVLDTLAAWQDARKKAIDQVKEHAIDPRTGRLEHLNTHTNRLAGLLQGWLETFRAQYAEYFPEE